MKSILKVKDVAKLFDTDPQNVRRWCRNEELPAVKIGRAYRISTAALIKWWADQGGGELSFSPDILTSSLFPDNAFPNAETESDEADCNNNTNATSVTSDKDAEPTSSAKSQRPKPTRKIVRK